VVFSARKPASTDDVDVAPSLMEYKARNQQTYC